MNTFNQPKIVSAGEPIVLNQKQSTRRAFKCSDFIYSQHKSQRTNALKELIAHRGISRCWHLIGYVWCNTNDHIDQADFWNDVWLRAYSREGEIRKSASFLMRKADRKFFENLPDLVTAYRGCLAYGDVDDLDVHVLGDSNVAGHSWTLDRNRAIWFAHRKHNRGRSELPAVAMKVFQKKEIVAYFNEIHEQEIVIPTHVLEWGIYVDDLILLDPNGERPSMPNACCFIQSGEFTATISML